MTLRVIELFSGIGAPRKALTNLGIEHTSTCVEIDPYAHASYEAIHGPTVNLGDIRQVQSLDKADLWTYGFPCQDLSVAGHRKGMEEGSGTRSSLLWEVGRLLRDAVERERESRRRW
ncbi:MAG: DNA cytosine methyltransferase [Thermoplasmata archaeon]|nr:DNA cytosine methyltransferase [Thermoplasmata archaeon]